LEEIATARGGPADRRRLGRKRRIGHSPRTQCHRAIGVELPAESHPSQICEDQHRIEANGSEEDLSRLESLCILFGIGLVIFDLDLKKPQFRIRVRAQRYLPDMFYVNEFADRLRQHNSEVFEHLFA